MLFILFFIDTAYSVQPLEDTSSIHGTPPLSKTNWIKERGSYESRNCSCQTPPTSALLRMVLDKQQIGDTSGPKSSSMQAFSASVKGLSGSYTMDTRSVCSSLFTSATVLHTPYIFHLCTTHLGVGLQLAEVTKLPCGGQLITVINKLGVNRKIPFPCGRAIWPETLLT